MKKAIFTLGLSGLIFGCEFSDHKKSDHHSAIQQFYSLFTEIEFDVLHVYSVDRLPATFKPESTYPYKGVEIDTSFYYLLKGVLNNSNETILFATVRFFISADMEALILRKYEDHEHRIHYLIYNNVKHTFEKDMELACSYGYEGSLGEMESWILDLNKDGKKDILTRSRSHNYYGREAREYYKDSVFISLWKENELVQVGISDTLLKAQFEEEFPYHTEPRLGYDSEKQLSVYLKEKENIIIPEKHDYSWCIIAGIHKDLTTAKNDIERAVKIIGMNHKYGLDWRNFEIYKMNDSCFTVIKGFNSGNEAEIALREVKKKFNNNAYLINDDLLKAATKTNFYE